MIYLIDWYKGCNGQRYLFVHALDLNDLWETLDMIGNPFDLRFRKWMGALVVPFDVETAVVVEDDGPPRTDTDIVRGFEDSYTKGSDAFFGMCESVREDLVSVTGWSYFAGGLPYVGRSAEIAPWYPPVPLQ